MIHVKSCRRWCRWCGWRGWCRWRSTSSASHTITRFFSRITIRIIYPTIPTHRLTNYIFSWPLPFAAIYIPKTNPIWCTTSIITGPPSSGSISHTTISSSTECSGQDCIIYITAREKWSFWFSSPIFMHVIWVTHFHIRNDSTILIIFSWYTLTTCRCTYLRLSSYTGS